MKSKLYAQVLTLCLSVSVLFPQNKYWCQVPGPTGGFINTILVRDSIMFVANQGGVYFSRDDGEMWTYAGLANYNTIKLDESGGMLYAATDYNFIFRTSNRGKTWENLRSNLSQQYGTIYDLIAKDSLVFIGTANQIWRSVNYGRTWELKNTGLTNYDFRKIFISNNVVTASAAGADGSGTYASTDWGETWVRQDSDQFAWNYEMISKCADTVYAADYANYPDLFKSSNDGLSWKLVSHIVTNSFLNTSLDVNKSGIYVGTFYAGIYRSTDGVSYHQVNNGLKNINYISQLANHDSSTFAGGYDGVYKYSPTQNLWSPKNIGLNNISVSTISTAGSYLFMGTKGNGLYKSSDVGRTWERCAVPKPYIKEVFVDGNRIYTIAGLDFTYCSFYRSDDGGTTWSEKANGIDAVELHTIHGVDSTLVLTSDYGVFLSSNYGDSWQLAQGFENNNRPNISSARMIDSVIICSYGYRSTDRGQSWTKTQLPQLGEIIYSLGKTFYAAHSYISALYSSSDYGITWKEMTFSPPLNSAVRGLCEDSNYTYVGLDRSGGVMKRARGSSYFFPMSDSLKNRNVNTISFSFERLWIGTEGSGAFQYIDSTLLSISISEPVPISSFLEQNYPNPFNPYTTITFQIPNYSYVSLKVYDILGREVSTPVNSRCEPGKYSVLLDASTFSSGIYFYRLRNGNYSEVKKMLLLK